MDILGHKLIALFTVLITIFISTALPIKVSEWFLRLGKKGQRIISAVMCFGGGFFLGTLLLHTLPEVVELVTVSINEPHDIHFPLAYFFVGCGFFMMVFMEKAVVELVHWRDRSSGSMDISVSEIETEDQTEDESKKIGLKTMNGKINEGFDVNHANNKDPEMASPKGNGGAAVTKYDDAKQDSGLDHGFEGFQGQAHDEAGHSHASGSAAKSIVLLLALSIDCVFEGLSLGLQLTISGVWEMVLAILSHEIVVAFGLGLQLIKYNSPLKALAMSFAYAVTAPVGIAIGLIINEGATDSDSFHITFGILLGITGGVFLYVTFLEILLHEFAHEMKMVNIVAVLLGFGIMAIIMGSGAHKHSHGHDDGHSNTTCGG